MSSAASEGRAPGGHRAGTVLAVSPVRFVCLVEQAIRHVLSFEACFVLYLGAPLYKTLPALARLPDLTAATLALSILVGGVVVLGRRVTWSAGWHRHLLLFIGLVLWMGATLLWAPARAMGATSKLGPMMTLTAWAMVGGVIIGQDEVRTRRFFVLFGGLGLLCVGRFLAFDPAQSRHGTVEGYLLFSEAIAVCATICIGLALFEERLPAWGSAGLLCAALGLTVALLLMGGRGPLIGTVVCMAGAMLVASLSPRPRGRQCAAGLLAALAAAGLWWTYIAPAGLSRQLKTVSRVINLLTDPTGGERTASFLLALDLWEREPLTGQGVGAYAVYGEYAYPHNILLEAMSELGLVGFVLVGAILALALVQALALARGSRRSTGACVFMVLVLLTMESMKSSDIVSPRWLWAFVGLSSAGASLAPLAPRRRAVPTEGDTDAPSGATTEPG